MLPRLSHILLVSRSASLVRDGKLRSDLLESPANCGTYLTHIAISMSKTCLQFMLIDKAAVIFVVEPPNL